MNHIKVLLFATLRDRAGGRKFIEIDIPDQTTVLGLKEEIAQDFPALKESMETVLVAIDHEYAFDGTLVSPGSEVAMFPPVSGG